MATLNRHYGSWAVGLLIVAVFAFMLFGMTGFRTVIAIGLLFVVPVLLLLKAFAAGLDVEEIVFFSLFIGVGVFGLLVWAVNQLLPSFRLSAVAALALVAAVAFFSPRTLSKWQKK